MNFKKNILLTFFILFTVNISSADVKKVIYASWEKSDVELWYVLPKEINEHTKVLFIIHGASRDVERYLNASLDAAKNKNVILVAPFFTKKSFPNYQTLGMAKSSGKRINDPSKELTNSISSFYTFFKSKYDIKSETYLIYGFSGGSQFVHRYLMYGDDKRVEKAAIGSAGWYTFLNNDPFPFGIKNMPIQRSRYEWFLSREVLFILGEDDDDPNHSALNINRGAINQGKHRYERGKNYFNNLINFSEEFEIPFRWRYKSVSGLDHNIEKMSDNAMFFLLSDLDYDY
tara:strand:+ start:1018 stop:1878 length:861 start_codon:yes stop_codon:yes gene_type:complete